MAIPPTRARSVLMVSGLAPAETPASIRNLLDGTYVYLNVESCVCQVVTREALAGPEVGLRPVAVLAPVVVSREEECVGDLATEAAGNVHELHQTDDGRSGHDEARTSYVIAGVSLNDLGLPVDHQTKRPSHGHHRDGFEGRVQSQAAHSHITSRES